MKACCSKEHGKAFCPICGERLTNNEYIGHGENIMRYEIGMFGYDLRSQVSLLHEMESRYENELKERRAGVEKMQAKMCRMHEALRHAQANGIS